MKTFDKVRQVNAFFKTAITPTIIEIKQHLNLTEFQEKILDMRYIKKYDIPTIATQTNASSDKVYKELGVIRDMLVQVFNMTGRG